MGNQYIKETVDWRAVTAEVNRRLESEYSVNYIQNIWNGNLTSSRILSALKDILPEEYRPGAEVADG